MSKMEFARDLPESSLGELLEGADVFLGLSKGGLVDGDMVATMANKPFCFGKSRS